MRTKRLPKQKKTPSMEQIDSRLKRMWKTVKDSIDEDGNPLPKLNGWMMKEVQLYFALLEYRNKRLKP